MIVRKNPGHVSLPLLLLLLALGFFFATYNLLTTVIRNKAADELDNSDPFTQLPENTGSGPNLRYHVALTATGAPYSQWQSQIMYYWYKKVKDMPGSDMGKFTRILHSGNPDNLREEIPTFVVDPLPKGLDREMGPVTKIDPIGNSPVIIKKSLLEGISPTWLNVSLRMKDDQDTDRAFGWVLEMYAYAVASALHGVRHILHKDFMLQPPWDLEVGKKFIIHYTYGCDYGGVDIWKNWRMAF